MALSELTGSATMHVSEGEKGNENRGDSSSLLTPAEHLTEFPQVKFARSIVVQAMTIADWVHGEGAGRIDFMWLDMQGMELPALKAAGPVLATTRAICMEVARKELYAGCAMYGEIISWMRGQGFRPIIDRVLTSWGNILFVRFKPRSAFARDGGVGRAVSQAMAAVVGHFPIDTSPGQARTGSSVREAYGTRTGDRVSNQFGSAKVGSWKTVAACRPRSATASRGWSGWAGCPTSVPGRWARRAAGYGGASGGVAAGWD